jgi:hypothetical protein
MAEGLVSIINKDLAVDKADKMGIDIIKLKPQSEAIINAEL